MKSYIVYIIRSGATKEETEGKYIGHTDVELSEEGRKQLENMRSELVYPPVGAVISSPLKRCTDTADSFNRYVSTYCHLRQEHIAGADKDLLDRCMACELYERRT